MSEPIYLLVIGKGWKEAWHQLSKEEQDNLWAEVEEIEKRVGSKLLVSCNSRWADEDVFDWGVLEYPSMEAYQKKVAELEQLNFWRYWSARTILGTKFKNPSEIRP